MEIWGSHTMLWAEPKKAIEYYEQALKISREIGDRRGEGNQSWKYGVSIQ